MLGQLDPSHVAWLPRWLMATSSSAIWLEASICWFFGTRIFVPDFVLKIASFVTCTQYDLRDFMSCKTRMCGMECFSQESKWSSLNDSRYHQPTTLPRASRLGSLKYLDVEDFDSLVFTWAPTSRPRSKRRSSRAINQRSVPKS